MCNLLLKKNKEKETKRSQLERYKRVKELGRRILRDEVGEQWISVRAPVWLGG
jgi:hypothetical protein